MGTRPTTRNSSSWLPEKATAKEPAGCRRYSGKGQGKRGGEAPFVYWGRAALLEIGGQALRR
jgi:hypothetical protein